MKIIIIINRPSLQSTTTAHIRIVTALEQAFPLLVQRDANETDLAFYSTAATRLTMPALAAACDEAANGLTSTTTATTATTATTTNNDDDDGDDDDDDGRGEKRAAKAALRAGKQ